MSKTRTAFVAVALIAGLVSASAPAAATGAPSRDPRAAPRISASRGDPRGGEPRPPGAAEAPPPGPWTMRKALPAPRAAYDPSLASVDVAKEAGFTQLTRGDLDPTPDVQITQEIIDKAAELGSVQAIYEFVRNGFEFQPYYGSWKGSVETFHQRAGNDYDLASLLIALLRASNVPARYAEGDVEMPVARAKSWLAVDSGEVAASALYTMGMGGLAVVSYPPGTSTCCIGHATPGCDDPDVQACVCARDVYCCDTQWDSYCAAEAVDWGCTTCPTEVVAVRAHRIWVEAYVARGYGGRTWVPLDPAFKLASVHAGSDIPEEMGLDAQAFIDDYVDPADAGVTLPRPETPVELLENRVSEYLATNHPGTTLEDVLRTHALVPESLEELPASLPYTVRSRAGSFVEIPAARRYQIRFHMYSGATQMIDHTLNLPEIAGKRISIDYVGATPADQAILDANGGIYRTPPSQVSLKPVLRVDGQDVAVGAAGIGMGLVHNSDVVFLQPVNASGQPVNTIPAIYNGIVAGASQVVGIAVEGVAETLALPPPADDTEGLASLRFDMAMDYLGRVYERHHELGRLMHMFVTTDVSDAIVENVVNVTYDLFGVPQTFTWKGLRVDADRSVMGIWPVGEMDAPDEEPRDYLILSGPESSLHESRVYEDSYGQDSVSTIKILELASRDGITIYKRWATLPLPPNTQSAAVRQQLEAAINGGDAVTFPADPQTIGTPETGQWTGTGWIDQNPYDGTAGYIISGGNHGGATVETWPPEFVDLSEDDKEIRQVEIEIVVPVQDSPDGSAIYTRDVEEKLRFEYVVHVTYSDGSARTLPAAGTYVKETRNTTRTFVPGNYDFKIWIARRVWWIFNSTIAEALRKVSIVGVLVRGPHDWWNPFACGSDPGKWLPVLPPAAGQAPVNVQACVYPDHDPSGGTMATGYAWAGGARLSFLTPGAQSTGIVPAGQDASAALDDQDVDVVVSLPGGKQSHAAARFDYAAGGADPKHKMTVYKVAMEYPSPPPLDVAATAPDFFGNEFAFTAASPSQVTVRCRATVEPNIPDVLSYVDDKLKWDIPGVSTFLGLGGWSWSNSWGFLSSSGKGHGINTALFATETDLPGHNADLGQKPATLQLKVGDTYYTIEARQIELLFPRLELNHPGSPSNAPNWFYYWKDGGICGITDSVEYDPGCAANWRGYYNSGENHVHICAAAAARNWGPEHYASDAGSGYGDIDVTGHGLGPYCVAETIGHENRHRHYHDTWTALIARDEADGENDGDDFDDPDNDGIPNVAEPNYDGVRTNPNDPDTFNMDWIYAGFGDNEIRCRAFELHHGIAVDTALDWSSPGTHSNPPYNP